MKRSGYIFIAFLALQTNLKSTINFSSSSSTLALTSSDASLQLEAPITNVNGNIQITDQTATSITQSAPANTITFESGGSLQIGDAFLKFDGVYDPDGSDEIQMDGNKTLVAESGSLAVPIVVSGTGNKLRGAPELTQPITLTDASTELDLGLTGKLTQNIVLNGGKVTLSKDLDMKDGTNITGDGTLDLAGHTLNLPSAGGIIFNDNLTFESGADISANQKITLNGNWNLSGGNNSIRGKGVIVDISGGGNINVNGSITADINNIHVKGLGASGGNISVNGPATALFTNCIFELLGDYTLMEGTMRFEGNGCKIITHDTEQFIVDDTLTNGSNVFIDGVIVEYDNLDELPRNPLVTANGGVITKINGGDIRSNYIPGTGNLNVAQTSNTLEFGIEVNPTAVLTFENATPVTPKTVTLDGQGNRIKMADVTGTSIALQENITLTVTNTIFENFDPNKIDFQGAGATLANIIFGDGCVLELGEDVTVNDSFAVSGNTTINGKGNKLNLLNPDSFLVDTAAKTLTVKNTKVHGLDTGRIRATTATAGIVWQDSNIILDNNYDVTTGFFTFLGQVQVLGKGHTLSYSSTEQSSILAESELTFGKGTTLQYNSADPTRILLSSNTSSLRFNSSRLYATVGITLDTGRLIIEDRVILQSDSLAGSGEEIILKDSLNIEILSAGILDIDGPVIYES